MNVAIYNGFGKYESTNDGQKGITLLFGGIPFWLPYDKVSYIPDYTIREVDHDKSAAASGDDQGTLTYMAFHMAGDRIADELLNTQIPYKNSDKGIIAIENTAEKRKNSYVRMSAGLEADGRPVSVEVQEITPTEFEIAEAHRRAESYKREMIQNYFQSKRERMAGGHGQVFPTGLVKVFMEELGVKDIDDVTKSLETVAQTPGMTPEMFLQAVKMIADSLKPAADTKADTKKQVASPV